MIDTGRRRGKSAGRFLLLGSASVALLKQSETLAGRITYLEMGPVDVLEASPEQQVELWVRGGFPSSLLANESGRSLIWRADFIRTYLERDIPMLGPRIPATTLRRFWTMLAHVQGGTFNAAMLGMWMEKPLPATRVSTAPQMVRRLIYCWKYQGMAYGLLR